MVPACRALRVLPYAGAADSEPAPCRTGDASSARYRPARVQRAPHGVPGPVDRRRAQAGFAPLGDGWLCGLGAQLPATRLLRGEASLRAQGSSLGALGIAIHRAWRGI